MDINQLDDSLSSLAESLRGADRTLLNARLNGLISAYPFNKYEYMLMFLLDKKIISFDAYEKLRDEYVSSNKYLDLFELAPRIFGEIWGHQHLMDLDRRFIRPNKTIDPEFKGQYDLLIESVRVEVKAARAINTKKRGKLASKALHYTSSDPFWMNFQQIKLDVSDVFIFIGVWADTIVYWLISNEEVKKNEQLSHQHRGGIEYQIGITNKNISDFKKFKVAPTKIGDMAIKKARQAKK